MNRNASRFQSKNNVEYDSNEDDSDDNNKKSKSKVNLQNIDLIQKHSSDEESEFKNARDFLDKDFGKSKSIKKVKASSKKLASNMSLNPKLNTISTSQLKEIREIAKLTKTISSDDSESNNSTENNKFSENRLNILDDTSKKTNNFVVNDLQPKSVFVYQDISKQNETLNTKDNEKINEFVPNILSNDKVI